MILILWDLVAHFHALNGWCVKLLAVPPPAVRPSIKQDSQQRSEDDLSHIFVNIIKANITLKDKIKNNGAENVINDWTTVLQYYIATMIDNNIPGVASVAQRSGRPLKSIKERINGKQGRVRGNLMGKRVDFSARSVITPDPNLSIKELGVPLKIAMNMTKPVTVTDNNKQFLLTLVRNGPDNFPGAKIVQRKNGENISLRYIDRESITINNGDTVHRHLMDGDYVLFNRQPTLHRMSMMSHVVKVLKRGNTFRMNVADTKPYNADFDGDEMNMHVPQDIEAEIELKTLAAVPFNIISPANNQPIIGIFQDSLLGCFQITRENISFTKKHAMNLLMKYNNINIDKLDNDVISSFDLLSQIFPPLTMELKTKLYDEDIDDKKTTNNIFSIKNGNITRGRIDKSVLGKRTRGVLHRITNDYGVNAASNFIDDLQNIITDYMKGTSYSVGISDLMANKTTTTAIIEKITNKKQEVYDIIHQTHMGIFKNKTGKYNNDEFESQVNNILNDAAAESGKIGRNNLNKNNRFVIMVNAGSKGSDLNISQMISCLGQQNVDGKRIPYGFDNRTLPHFKKYDDTPNARGFVENSFIGGLKPEELFFHAMGGRVGLIDTACKTSQTGYIQRRLIKGLEDYKVEYDMTVRNHKNQIIQYKYGGDGFDSIKIESQRFKLFTMTIDDIYAHYNMNDNDVFEKVYSKEINSKIKSQRKEVNKKCKKYIDMMIKIRNLYIIDIYHNTANNMVHCPIDFENLIINIKNKHNIQSNSIIDITPLDAFNMIEETFNTLNKYIYNKPNKLFESVYFFFMSPQNLLLIHRYNKKTLTILLEHIILYYKTAIVNPSEMVGMIAAQSIGEPTTQMTLNTFHFAGVASKSNVTRGVPRVEEILSLTKKTKNPSLTIYLHDKDKFNREHAQNIMYSIEYTALKDLVEFYEICYDPDDSNTMIKEDKELLTQFNHYENMFDECNDSVSETSGEKSKWIIRIKLDKSKLLEKNITQDDINFTLKVAYQNKIDCVYSDYNSSDLIFRIRINGVFEKKSGNPDGKHPLDQSDQIWYITNFQNQLMSNTIIRGIKDIEKVLLRKIPNYLVYEEGNFVKKTIWVLDTVGTNLVDVLGLYFIDPTKTISNSIMEVYDVLGIEAARQCIYNEFSEVIEADGSYINSHHLEMLADRMSYSYKLISIYRHGINNDNIGPIAKAAFEETPEMFLRAAKHGLFDEVRGVSANIMCGQEGFFGTGSFDILLDINKLSTLKKASIINDDTDSIINKTFGSIENPNDPCSMSNITINNNSINIDKVDLGKIDNSYELDM